MADVCDDAQDLIEKEMAIRLRQRRRVLPYTGQCYNCQTDVPEPKKYCDGDCEADHEFRLRMEKRNG